MEYPDPVQVSFDDILSESEQPESIQQQFLAYHERHPEVYRLLVTLARKACAKGRKVGMKCLWERLRWEIWISRDDDFKLNNNYTSRYARLIMEREWDLRGYFETRELKS